MNAIAEVERLARELVTQSEYTSKAARDAIAVDESNEKDVGEALSGLEDEIEKHDRATNALDLALIQLDVARTNSDQFSEIRALVRDPEANGGLECLQDCGLDMLEKLLNHIDSIEGRKA